MTSISKNVCIDKLDDIVNKYNNIYHRTIKTKFIDVRSSTYIDFEFENNDKITNLKFVAVWEHQNIKRFFEKG